MISGEDKIDDVHAACKSRNSSFFYILFTFFPLHRRVFSPFLKDGSYLVTAIFFLLTDADRACRKTPKKSTQFENTFLKNRNF